MADTEAKTSPAYISRLLRAGTTHSARELNERLVELRDARWRVLPGGDGLEAVDRRGVVKAVLYFEDTEEGAGR